MTDASSNPMRSRGFRLTTVTVSGVGSFVLGFWGLKMGFGGQIAGLPAEILAPVLAALCALSAALAAMSFFAGVDESVSYVVK